ncbi:hypothetical protein SLEP1_g58623 [Rubroshorea leprosula]|uniref:Reverse transcriptase domain-containing protein n=1 Tax=Rubroshorea leprosula TaxID=152421 RepID=A0AAV5MSN0_9ROSI|nr:hypothetical protein SLEP1_g58623 [Rubroshorea leprosula]
MLVAPFTEEQVKQTIWECDSNKAPGPDGFHFGFLKAMWSEIKKEILNFVTEFQVNGRMVRGLNAAFIVMIPKKENPQKIEDFRPISLIGSMYKIIAKLLANHLKRILGNIIGEEQFAFVGDRPLMDGVLIANEVVEVMLNIMGFCETWNLWIRECLKTSMVSVLVNGSATREFGMSRGLRQGDPLSPFLFLIVAEGLNGIISSAKQKNMFKGVSIGGRGLIVSHLQFADDTVIIGDATERNVWAVKAMMRTFELVSGLRINYSKSQLLSINVEKDWRERMADLPNCTVGEFPFKYLGIPVGGNLRRLAIWCPLMERCRNRLSLWNGQFLSFGGRIALINSMLSSLPVFLLSMYKIPRGVIEEIDTIRRRFLWGEVRTRRKWRGCVGKMCVDCRDKNEGGLGIKNLRWFNLALLGKWRNRLLVGGNELWKRVLREKYVDNEGDWMKRLCQSKRARSTWWQDICNINNGCLHKKEWLGKGFKRVIGEGKITSFWKDVWVGEQELMKILPRLFSLSTGKNNSIHGMGTWSNGKWRWTFFWRRQLYEWEKELEEALLKMLEHVQPVEGKKDKWQWHYDKEGKYKVKDVYNFLQPTNSVKETCFFKKTWNALVPLKVCGFSWQLLQNRIPTKKNLRNRDITIRDNSCKNVFHQHYLFGGTKEERKAWDVLWFAIIWSLWLHRNGLIFKDLDVEENGLLEMVQMRSYQWIRSKTKFCAFSFPEWQLNPKECIKALQL